VSTEPDIPTAELPPREGRENQLRFVINVGVQRWRLIAAFTVATMLVAGLLGMYRYEAPRGTYGARADVILKPSVWDKDVLRDVGGPSFTPLTPKALIQRTSIETLAEDLVQALVQRDVIGGGPWSRVVTQEEVAEKKAQLLGQLSFLDDPQSGLIHVEVIGCRTQEEAKDIAEFAARVFVQINHQYRLDEERETHEVAKKRLHELQEALYAAEATEWEFKRNMGFRTYNKVSSEMLAMHDELNEKKATRDEIVAKLAQIEAELDANTQLLPEALGNVTDSVVTELLDELNSLLKEKLEMSVIYQPSFEGIQVLQDTIDEKKQEVLQAVRMLDEGEASGSDVWEIRRQLYRQEMDLRLQLTSIDIRIAALQGMLEEMVPQIPELANNNLEYERLAQETQHIRSQFNKLREREFEIRTALSRSSGQVQRHGTVIPLPHMSPGVAVQTWVNFVLGAGLGFVVGFCLALMLEMMDTSIRSIEDITQFIGLDVIGTIPRMRFGKPKGSKRKRGTYVTTVDEEQIDACIVTQHEPKSPISESYRTMRTNFQFATLQQNPTTVMVTSPVPGEGKTTTAVNMAVTMADRGMRVLVVDTDLRRPNVHRVLRIERGPGLADVLREDLDPMSVVRPTSVENLWIISSGRVPPNPSELIGSQRMDKVIKTLGEQFDMVICDAPSILVVTDPVLLATHVDTVVLVVSVNNARRETVRRACELLRAADASMAGVVLNGIEVSRRHYYYYYYYYDDAGARSTRRWYHL